MSTHLKLVAHVPHKRFEFDYNRNAVFFESSVIRLSPHEADILKILLKNRARVTPLSALIQGVYGITQPDTAAISIRVAIHSLRKKLAVTGMKIKAEARVGYEIDVENMPELNLGLNEKILSAFNVAQASGAREIAGRLQAMLVDLERPTPIYSDISRYYYAGAKNPPAGNAERSAREFRTSGRNATEVL